MFFDIYLDNIIIANIAILTQTITLVIHDERNGVFIKLYNFLPIEHFEKNAEMY